MTFGRSEPGPRERRRGERVRMPEVDAPVRVVGARLIDVSPFGMRIESPLAMQVDSKLFFRIVVEGKASDVSCRVAFCRPAGTPQSRWYEIGLDFLDLSAEACDRLREVLQRPAPAPAR